MLIGHWEGIWPFCYELWSPREGENERRYSIDIVLLSCGYMRQYCTDMKKTGMFSTGIWYAKVWGVPYFNLRLCGNRQRTYLPSESWLDQCLLVRIRWCGWPTTGEFRDAFSLPKSWLVIASSNNEKCVRWCHRDKGSMPVGTHSTGEIINHTG